MIMELVSHDMPVQQARRAYLDYKHDIDKRKQKVRDKISAAEARLLKEDEEMMAAYKAMSQGKRVINFIEACSAMGWKEDTGHLGLPEIAICRASAQRCALVFGHKNGRMDHPMFVDSETAHDYWSRHKLKSFNQTVVMPRELWDKEALEDNHNKVFKCKVPTIPLKFRPAVGQLPKYHLIFEAEWDLVAPLDPFLVKRISEHYFAIVAQWDLTPLERSMVGVR